jgi:transcriptional antiterminator Rof (Rho-off)
MCDGTIHVALLIRSPLLFTTPDNTEAAALRARLEAIIKEAEDAKVQAATARRRVQATCLLLEEEEESKAVALEQMTITARQRVPSSSSSSLAAASQLIPTASSTYEGTVITRLHLQAATVLNVCQLVNIVLDSSSTNYASWCDLMEHALQR